MQYFRIPLTGPASRPLVGGRQSNLDDVRKLLSAGRLWINEDYDHVIFVY